MTSGDGRTACAVPTLMTDERRARELRAEAAHLPAWDLTPFQTHDLEMLMCGGFSPLRGFLGKTDYDCVRRDMRLADGRLWPIPVTLDVSEAFAATLESGRRMALRHPEGTLLAVLTVSDLLKPDRTGEAQDIYGTIDDAHPGVHRLLHETQPVYVGGAIEGIEPPPHHAFDALRKTPSELRAHFESIGASRVVAFQTRNPMHRSHVALTLRASERASAHVLIHPVVGAGRPGDIDAFTRVRCYRAVLGDYPEGTVTLSLLPLAMRMAGPREALWHALIRANYGCTHFIVGRDHAGPGSDRSGKPFYPPDAAQKLAKQHQKEAGIEILAFDEMVWVPDVGRYLEVPEVPRGHSFLSLSGTELRRRLQDGAEIPSWFTGEAVVKELRRSHPPRERQGFTVFFTGLSGSGKSTIAGALTEKLNEIGSRAVTVLDGDLVRKNLSSGLGFTRADRDTNIQRIAFVAAEITKNGGAAVCAQIAPYGAARRQARETIVAQGGFIEVWVSTPLDVCAGRDRKGLYEKARAGLITGFTGVNDPYEAPEKPDIVIDGSTTTPEDAAEMILARLAGEGYLGDEHAPKSKQAERPVSA